MRDRFAFYVWMGRMVPVFVLFAWAIGMVVVIKAGAIIFGLVKS